MITDTRQKARQVTDIVITNNTIRHDQIWGGDVYLAGASRLSPGLFNMTLDRVLEAHLSERMLHPMLITCSSSLV